MLPVLHDLARRERLSDPVRVGVIGTGFFGAGLVRQLAKVAGMEPSVVAGRTAAKAADALLSAGIERRLIVDCDDVAVARAALQRGNYVATARLDLAAELAEIDVVMEATGSIEVGSRLALAAFAAGKHFVAANLEVQGTVGPRLQQLAQQAGVVYSDVDGDQPGMIMNLHAYCLGLGLEPLVAGNCKGFLNLYATPASQTAYASQNGIAPWIACAAADGTKINLEMAAVANATGMLPARLGMTGLHTSLETLLADLAAQGLLERGPLVEYTFGIPSGVFIIARSGDVYLQAEFRYLKMGDGPCYVFHDSRVLCHFDAPLSAARAVLYGTATIAPLAAAICEVGSFAKRDLRAGQRLDGIGGYDCYGQVYARQGGAASGLLPIGLAEGAILRHDLARDAAIDWDSVEIETETLPLQLWREQQALISTAPTAL